MKLGKIIKTFKSKKGNEVVFRYPKPEDLEAMWKYVNNLIIEDTFVQITGKPLALKEEKQHLEEVLRQMRTIDRIHVVVLVNDKYAGNGEIRRGKYRRRHVGELGLSLAAQYRGEGIGGKLLAILIDEGRRIGLRLLIIHCFENNKVALSLYGQFGFKKIGRIPQSILFKGKYIDDLILYLPLV